MSWLAHRWRTQRNAIRIVNCRFPWTIRFLNAYGAVGISPAARLFQCLLTIPIKPFCDHRPHCKSDAGREIKNDGSCNEGEGDLVFFPLLRCLSIFCLPFGVIISVGGARNNGVLWVSKRLGGFFVAWSLVCLGSFFLFLSSLYLVLRRQTGKGGFGGEEERLARFE